MTDLPQSARYRDARTFSAGAACGFLAGALAASVLLWEFGGFVGLGRTAGSPRADPSASVARGKPGDGDPGPVAPDEAKARPAPTSGRDAPPVPPAVDGPPPLGGETPAPVDLVARDLAIPVDGIRPDQLTRQFTDKRGSAREHEALDILAPRNTPVRAVEGGRIARLFLSKAGGITVYQFDPSERYCYYYAHLERYADGLREGDIVTKGQLLGYVGTSGNAAPDAPHLHFAVFRLTDEKRWWEGTPVDPYDLLR